MTLPARNAAHLPDSATATTPHWLLLRLLSGLRCGSLDVRLPGGSLHCFRGSTPGGHAELHIHHGDLLRRLLLGGDIGFAESYMDGGWDSPDLTQLLCVLYANQAHFQHALDNNAFGRLLGWAEHQLRSNSRWMSRRNIEYHYDLGNAFYRLWLDDSMAYSSAVFTHPEQSLHDAQLNKFHLMLKRLQLSSEHQLLEIGSGWGGFALYAARETGCRVHSITLSTEQLDEARRRAQAAGLADRVTFELRDYRDLSKRYDRIVSIEMIEAVGERYWPDYFATLHRSLRPGGRAAIQGITIADEIFSRYRRKRDFIQKYIFPGGMLAPASHWQALASDAGLQVEAPSFHGLDYARTLALWHQEVIRHGAQISAMYSPRFLRMWRYYLAYCECGFLSRSTDLMQMSLRA